MSFAPKHDISRQPRHTVGSATSLIHRRAKVEGGRHHSVRSAERRYGVHRRNIARWLEIRLTEVKERKKLKLTWPREKALLPSRVRRTVRAVGAGNA